MFIKCQVNFKQTFEGLQTKEIFKRGLSKLTWLTKVIRGAGYMATSGYVRLRQATSGYVRRGCGSQQRLEVNKPEDKMKRGL